ncbi:hypothetical protein [Fulvivirga ligni]|uniref:hypothetical protein n=1 Tax=Fulvivirga ligni TaxID=2904246 RepID=UPI001F1BA49A|nr:hypothetical protein [Fulvivirga ligni]UII23047.1 hypothetical protein LVD16_07390 [Fulvivirga ligni]
MLFGGSTMARTDGKAQMADVLARSLAKSLRDERVRALVKREVLEKRDGDYNVLFARIKDVIVPNSNTPFYEVLGRNSGMNKDQWKQYLDEVESNFPLLQIAVPELPEIKPEEWNIGEHIPAVAINNLAGYTPTLKGYSNEVEPMLFDTDVPPEELTVVVSENERLLVFSAHGPDIEIPPFYYNKLHILIEKIKYYDWKWLHWDDGGFGDGDDDGDDNGGGSGGDTEVDCDGKDGDRITNNDKDNYNKWKFTTSKNAKKAEPWASGAFEMRAVIIRSNVSNESLVKIEKFVIAPRADVIDCNAWGNNCSLFWFNVDAEVITWEPELHGLEMMYEFIEEDSGPDITLTLGATLQATEALEIEGGVQVNIPVNHDKLGSSIVEYCDNTDGEGTKYNTGSLYFYVNQQ